jgi:hypothetical protein
MLHRTCDRFARPVHRRIRVADRARLPLDRLGSDDVYRHTWAVESFPGPAGLRHCVNIVRLADGLRKTIAAHWWTRYAD